MGLSTVDLLKTAFGGLKTDVGKKLIGVFFIVQLISFGGGTLLGQASPTVAVLASVVAGILGIVASIGGMRAFREEEISKKHFTDNILWPAGRTLGANIIGSLLGYMVAILFLIPAGIISFLSGATLSGGITSVASGNLMILALGGLGLILGVAAFFYILVAIFIAQPLIAIDDRRMFQALDESIQRTKGNRLSIFLALVGLIVVYLTLAVVASAVGTAVGPMASSVLTTLVIAPVMTPVSLCLFNYLTEELPEAE